VLTVSRAEYVIIRHASPSHFSAVRSYKIRDSKSVWNSF